MERLTFQSFLLEVFGSLHSERSLATGTGFVMATPAGRPMLITARHNVTGRDQITGEPLSSTGVIPRRLVAFVRNLFLPSTAQVIMYDPPGRADIDLRGREDDLPRWYEHPALGPVADVVAVPFGPPVPWTVSSEGDIDMAVGPSARVSIIGFPLTTIAAMRNSATWSTGFVASEPNEDYDGLPTFLVDCRARPGQSGSPVYRFARQFEIYETVEGGTTQRSPYAARLLGIYVGRIHKDSDLGRVWKFQVIRDLLASIDAGAAFAASVP
jgi:hypothetical protein